MKRFGNWLLLTLAPWLAAHIIRLLGRSARRDIVGAETVQNLWRQGQPVILSFWHDQLLLMSQGYLGPGAQILISASKDGELIARTMHHLGQHAVRGSSSRGGGPAFRQLLRLARGTLDLVVTPDGPRGPRHELKEGVIQLARLSGRPVVPMALASSRGHRFASWDRFLLPYPFARLVFVYGAPLYCRKEDDPQRFRQQLEQAMKETQLIAEQRLTTYGLSAV